MNNDEDEDFEHCCVVQIKSKSMKAHRFLIPTLIFWKTEDSWKLKPWKLHGR